MRAGKILVIVVAILALVGIQDFMAHGENVIRTFFDNLNGRPDHHGAKDIGEFAKQSRSDKIVLPATDIQGLQVVNPRGDIEIRGTEGEEIVIDYTLSVFADKEKQAGEYLAQLCLKQETVNGILSLRLAEPKIREEFIYGVGASYTIAIPRGIAAKIVNSNGKVTGENIVGDLDISNTNGAVSLTDITGDVNVYTRNCDLELGGITGNVKAETAYRGVFIIDVQGNLAIQSNDNYVGIEGVRGQVVIGGRGSRMDVRDVEGSIEAVLEAGKLQAENIEGSVTAEGGYDAEVELEKIAGNMRVNTRYGDIHVELSKEAGYQISADVQRGKIRSRLPLDLQNEGLSQRAVGTLGDGKYRVDLSVEAGNIIIGQD